MTEHNAKVASGPLTSPPPMTDRTPPYANLRYGVQFDPETLDIFAGTVRKSADRDVFIAKCPVTQQVIGAAALWVLTRSGNAPCRFVDRSGTTYELAVKVIT